jgi:hypothetical protein
MTRKNVTVESLRSKGFEGICDFSLEQCEAAIKRGDKYDMTNNGAYIRVRFTGEDGWATGDMMRRCTDDETAKFLENRSMNTYQIRREQRPDWKQDD